MVVVVSLLRGVNLGGHRRIKMDALREAYESLGLRDVRTFLQSGNVLFRAPDRSLDAAHKRIERAIEQRFGFCCDVVLRTEMEMRDVIARNPFADRKGIDPSRLLVTFLAGDPHPEASDRLAGLKDCPEELCLLARELYIYYPDGIGRSKLTQAILDRKLGAVGTARNWNTVTKLCELAQSMG